LMQSIRTSGLAATMLVTGGELQKLEAWQKLIAVGFRIVGSVLTDMSTPLRPSEPPTKIVTVRVPPAVSEKLIGTVGQLVDVVDAAIHTVPVKTACEFGVDDTTITASRTRSTPKTANFLKD